jgi:hypothetical protein
MCRGASLIVSRARLVLVDPGANHDRKWWQRKRFNPDVDLVLSGCPRGLLRRAPSDFFASAMRTRRLPEGIVTVAGQTVAKRGNVSIAVAFQAPAGKNGSRSTKNRSTRHGLRGTGIDPNSREATDDETSRADGAVLGSA